MFITLLILSKSSYKPCSLCDLQDAKFTSYSQYHREQVHLVQFDFVFNLMEFMMDHKRLRGWASRLSAWQQNQTGGCACTFFCVSTLHKTVDCTNVFYSQDIAVGLTVLTLPWQPHTNELLVFCYSCWFHHYYYCMCLNTYTKLSLLVTFVPILLLTKGCNKVHYLTVTYNGVQFDTVQYNIFLFSPIQFRTMWYITIK